MTSSISTGCPAAASNAATSAPERPETAAPIFSAQAAISSRYLPPHTPQTPPNQPAPDLQAFDQLPSLVDEQDGDQLGLPYSPCTPETAANYPAASRVRPRNLFN